MAAARLRALPRDPYSYHPTEKTTYKYPEGDIYEGDWSKEGKKHGTGMLKMVDGSVYNGKFLHGFFHGYGILAFQDGSHYEGEFVEGVFGGHGIYTRVDGMMFEGRFRDGRTDGPGLITFPDGSHGHPRLEGLFRGTQLVRRESAYESVNKARVCAQRALKAKSEFLARM